MQENLKRIFTSGQTNLKQTNQQKPTHTLQVWKQPLKPKPE